MNKRKVARHARQAILASKPVRKEFIEAAHSVRRRNVDEDLLADLRDAIDPLHKQRMGTLITGEIAAAVGLALVAGGVNRER